MADVEELDVVVLMVLSPVEIAPVTGALSGDEAGRLDSLMMIIYR